MNRSLFCLCNLKCAVNAYFKHAITQTGTTLHALWSCTYHTLDLSYHIGRTVPTYENELLAFCREVECRIRIYEVDYDNISAVQMPVRNIDLRFTWKQYLKVGIKW